MSNVIGLLSRFAAAMFGLLERTVWRSFAPSSRQASRAPVHEEQAAGPDKGIRLDCLTAAQRWKYHGRLPVHQALLSGKSHVSSSAPPFRGHRPPFSVSSGAHSCPVDVFETACEEIGRAHV